MEETFCCNECGGPLTLVDRTRTTTQEADGEDSANLAGKGRTFVTYSIDDRVWFCTKCGKDSGMKEMKEG